MDKEIWKTIRLGTIKNLKKELGGNGINTSSYANDILKKMDVSKKEIEVDLVNISVKELGFNNSATLKDIYAKAKEYGFELCPNEVGPQLRLQYEDQPMGEWLIIGMEPIAGSGGGRGLFRVGHGSSGLWLHTHHDRPRDLW